MRAELEKTRCKEFILRTCEDLRLDLFKANLYNKPNPNVTSCHLDVTWFRSTDGSEPSHMRYRGCWAIMLDMMLVSPDLSGMQVKHPTAQEAMRRAV